MTATFYGSNGDGTIWKRDVDGEPETWTCTADGYCSCPSCHNRRAEERAAAFAAFCADVETVRGRED